MAGDLSRIVLFAMAHTARKTLRSFRPKNRTWPGEPNVVSHWKRSPVKLWEWSEAESVSVNAIVVSMLEDFFKQFRKSHALRDELR